MNEIFKCGVIEKERLSVRSQMFRDTLKGRDKNSWYPIVRDNSFAQKLPGTIMQNAKFIQYLPILLYQELQSNPEFLKSKIWKFFILLKNLSEFFQSTKLSDYQVE